MAVEIAAHAYKKVHEYAKQAKSNEIGGLLMGLVGGGEIVVKDAIILKQKRTSASFELEDGAMMDFTKNATAKQLASVIGWWHSHGNYGTFWSGPDDDCFKRMCGLSGFCLGVVVSWSGFFNRTLEMRCRLDIKDMQKRRISIDNLTPQIEDEYVVMDSKRITEEVGELVTDGMLDDGLGLVPLGELEKEEHIY